jgi:YidC/Oxa1 family membrane protein insertase
MDINKRTILWIVFSVSLVVLWNNWQISNGHPSMFSAARQTAKAPDPGQDGLACRRRAAVPGEVADPPRSSRAITITTDVIRPTSTPWAARSASGIAEVQGRSQSGLVRRLLRPVQWCQPDEGKQNEVLFDEGANHTYLAHRA